MTGEITDMKELGVWEPFAVKAQTLKTAVEAASMLLRIDDIVSGIGKKKTEMIQQGKKSGVEVEDHNDVDSEMQIDE